MRRHLDLEALIEPMVNNMGYSFIGLEYSPSKGNVLLRIYIDSVDEGKGIGVEDCKKVSYQIYQVLNVESNLNGNYTLEVSSPGIDRKLYTIEQCIAQVGKTIKLNLAYSVETQRNFTGILRAVTGAQLMLQTNDGREMMFNFEDINRAQVIPEW